MKLYLTTFALLLTLLLNAQIPYTLSFPGLRGDTIRMGDYAGKKLLVAVVDAASPDADQLHTLDSLYEASDSSFSVLLVPADDWGEAVNDSTLSAYLTDSLHLPFAAGATGKAAKSNNESQQPLLRWLTHAEDNMHFDEDIRKAGQLYMLDEDGTLFGLFEKQTPPDFLHYALQQPNHN